MIGGNNDMLNNRIEAAISIRCDPVSLIRFIADVRNHSEYFGSQRSVSNITGEPGEASRSWTWTWDLFGRQYEGNGAAIRYDEGRSYVFVTDGGIRSRVEIVAEPDQTLHSQGGTRLTVNILFRMPDGLEDHDDPNGMLTVAQVRAQDAATFLKTLMEYTERGSLPTDST